MKVTFVQSGGFAGVVKGCELDTSSLPPNAARELEDLVSGSGLTGSGTFLSKTGRDLHQYEISIVDGDRKTEVVVDESTLPPSASRFVGYLKKQARPSGVR